MKNRSRRALVGIVVGILSAGSAGWGQSSIVEPLLPVQSVVSKPSLRLQLQFFAPGLVREWNVRPGDAVTRDQILITQDSRLLEKEIAKLDLEASSTHQVDAAKAQLAVSRVLLERKMESASAFSKSELDEAKLQVEIGDIRVKLAEQERAKAAIDAEGARMRLEFMRLKSPIDGQVVGFGVGPGEMAQPDRPQGAAEVVQNNPLWVELVIPIEQAALLRAGDRLTCKHVDGTPAEGTVVYFSPVAQGDTQLVRLEVPNPELRSSGLPVEVSLPTQPAGSAAAGR